MRTNSLLFKKTNSYLATVNVQNRAPVFFLDQLNKLGLVSVGGGISKDLDFTGSVYIIASLDVRVLSKTRLDFLLTTLSGVKFRKAGLLKASILSAFALKGKLKLPTGGLAGFDGLPHLVLRYADYSSALCPSPVLAKEDFLDDEEAKEWTSISQAFSPVFVSFGGCLFPYEFFKDQFSGLTTQSELISAHLIHKATLHASALFNASFSEFAGLVKAAVSYPTLSSVKAAGVLNGIFFQLVNRRLCQQ